MYFPLMQDDISVSFKRRAGDYMWAICVAVHRTANWPSRVRGVTSTTVVLCAIPSISNPIDLTVVAGTQFLVKNVYPSGIF